MIRLFYWQILRLRYKYRITQAQCSPAPSTDTAVVSTLPGLSKLSILLGGSYKERSITATCKCTCHRPGSLIDVLKLVDEARASIKGSRKTLMDGKSLTAFVLLS